MHQSMLSSLSCFFHSSLPPFHSSFNLFMEHQLWARYYCKSAAAAAKSLQSCPTLCDGSPPGSPIPGILKARTLEWVAISFSNAWKWKVKVKLLSRVQPSATPWTAAFQAPPPWDFPGKSTGVGCHCLHYSYLKLLISWRMCSFVHKSYLNVSFFMCSYTIIWYSQANFLWIIIN